jgi:hypothetical protein
LGSSYSEEKKKCPESGKNETNLRSAPIVVTGNKKKLHLTVLVRLVKVQEP